MKHCKIILVVLAFVTISCNDFLNEPPLDRITESDVWSDKDLMDTYIYQIYEKKNMFNWWIGDTRKILC